MHASNKTQCTTFECDMCLFFNVCGVSLASMAADNSIFKHLRILVAEFVGWLAATPSELHATHSEHEELLAEFSAPE